MVSRFQITAFRVPRSALRIPLSVPHSAFRSFLLFKRGSHTPDLIQVDSRRLVFKKPIQVLQRGTVSLVLAPQDRAHSTRAWGLRVDGDHGLQVAKHCPAVRFLFGQPQQVGEYAKQNGSLSGGRQVIVR
jgi:hypothetical protein